MAYFLIRKRDVITHRRCTYVKRIHGKSLVTEYLSKVKDNLLLNNSWYRLHSNIITEKSFTR